MTGAAVLQMKIAGFLLLVSGWLIVVAAIAVLASVSARTAFVIAGCGVELLGIALILRWHLSERKRER